VGSRASKGIAVGTTASIAAAAASRGNGRRSRSRRAAVSGSGYRGFGGIGDDRRCSPERTIPAVKPKP
jgi:hypothetical protein